MKKLTKRIVAVIAATATLTAFSGGVFAETIVYDNFNNYTATTTTDYNTYTADTSIKFPNSPWGYRFESYGGETDGYGLTRFFKAFIGDSAYPACDDGALVLGVNYGRDTRAYRLFNTPELSEEEKLVIEIDVTAYNPDNNPFNGGDGFLKLLYDSAEGVDDKIPTNDTELASLNTRSSWNTSLDGLQYYDYESGAYADMAHNWAGFGAQYKSITYKYVINSDGTYDLYLKINAPNDESDYPETRNIFIKAVSGGKLNKMNGEVKLPNKVLLTSKIYCEYELEKDLFNYVQADNFKVYTVESSEAVSKPVIFDQYGNVADSADIVSGAKLTATAVVNSNAANVPVTIISAIYDSEGYLKKAYIGDDTTYNKVTSDVADASNYNVVNIDFTLPADVEAGDYVKAYVWDGIDTMIPYSVSSNSVTAAAN